ncbi:hypothetical protein ACHAPT_012860 [Fusarium lateritium]
MGLTVGQAIGIGVAVGFAGALFLMTVVSCIFRASSAESLPPIPVTTRIEGPPRHSIDGQQNSIRESARTLPERIWPLKSADAISEGVYFEAYLNTLVGGIADSRQRARPHIPPSIFDEDELVRLAGEPINGGTWSESISNLITRVPAVTCFLAQIMFKRMHPSCPVQESLLPPEISSCYQLVCRIYGNLKVGQTESHSLSMTTEADQTAGENFIAVWRECVYLLQESPWRLQQVPPHPCEKDDLRKGRTRAMAPAIVNALQLGSLRNDMLQKEGQLERIMGEALEVAANSAMILLGQPSEWEAVWASAEPGFIVFPEVRLVWNGRTKYSRPAVVNTDFVWPMRPDGHNQPKSEVDKSDVGRQPRIAADEDTPPVPGPSNVDQ